VITRTDGRSVTWDLSDLSGEIKQSGVLLLTRWTCPRAGKLPVFLLLLELGQCCTPGRHRAHNQRVVPSCTELELKATQTWDNQYMVGIEKYGKRKRKGYCPQASSSGLIDLLQLCAWINYYAGRNLQVLSSCALCVRAP
jgi:hypothetical protein